MISASQAIRRTTPGDSTSPVRVVPQRDEPAAAERLGDVRLEVGHEALEVDEDDDLGLVCGRDAVGRGDPALHHRQQAVHPASRGSAVVGGDRVAVLVLLGAGDRERVDRRPEDGGALRVEHATQTDHARRVGRGEPEPTRLAPPPVEAVLVARRADLLGVVPDESGEPSSGRAWGAWSVRSASAVVRSSGSATGLVRWSKSTICAALPTVTCWVATSRRSRAHRASARAVPTVTNALA